MKWFERASLGLLRPRDMDTGHSPSVFRCPDCPATFTDSEVAYAHVMSHPARDRRRTTRTVAAA